METVTLRLPPSVSPEDVTPIPKLLGFGHKLGVGKDEAAAPLRREGWRIVKFAKPVYDLLWEIDPLVAAGSRLRHLVNLHGWEIRRTSPEVRRLLVAIGDGARRQIDPDVWVRAAHERVEHYRRHGCNVVVTDVRYPNEAEAIHHLGGEVWRIDRPGRLGSDRERAAPTETALDNWGGWDGVIANDGSVEDLHDKVRELFLR